MLLRERSLYSIYIYSIHTVYASYDVRRRVATSEFVTSDGERSPRNNTRAVIELGYDEGAGQITTPRALEFTWSLCACRFPETVSMNGS